MAPWLSRRCVMNVDDILKAFNAHRVAYILIGGVNFLLRHAPVLTYDFDVWIDDTPENLGRCEKALCDLEAEWGASEEDWRPVADKLPGWLGSQAVFCLTSPHGAIDVFRSVRGLTTFAASRAKARTGTTAAGTPYVGLSDDDMLACQIALPPAMRNQQRIDVLKQASGTTEHERRDG